MVRLLSADPRIHVLKLFPRVTTAEKREGEEDRSEVAAFAPKDLLAVV